MERVAPWLLVVLASAVTCGSGAVASVSWAAVASLDGSRAWWTADLRAAVLALCGLAASGVATLVVAVAGGLVIRASTTPPPGPAPGAGP